MRKPGRLRVKLAALLSEALPDVIVHPEDLWYSLGDYKKTTWGAPRWEGLGKTRGVSNSVNNLSVSFRSYSTMTDCARNGIDITRDSLCNVEVDAKSPKAKKPKETTE